MPPFFTLSHYFCPPTRYLAVTLPRKHRIVLMLNIRNAPLDSSIAKARSEAQNDDGGVRNCGGPWHASTYPRRHPETGFLDGQTKDQGASIYPRRHPETGFRDGQSKDQGAKRRIVLMLNIRNAPLDSSIAKARSEAQNDDGGVRNCGGPWHASTYPRRHPETGFLDGQTKDQGASIYPRRHPETGFRDGQSKDQGAKRRIVLMLNIRNAPLDSSIAKARSEAQNDDGGVRNCGGPWHASTYPRRHPARL